MDGHFRLAILLGAAHVQENIHGKGIFLLEGIFLEDAVVAEDDVAPQKPRVDGAVGGVNRFLRGIVQEILSNDLPQFEDGPLVDVAVFLVDGFRFLPLGENLVFEKFRPDVVFETALGDVKAHALVHARGDGGFDLLRLGRRQGFLAVVLAHPTQYAGFVVGTALGYGGVGFHHLRGVPNDAGKFRRLDDFRLAVFDECRLFLHDLAALLFRLRLIRRRGRRIFVLDLFFHLEGQGGVHVEMLPPQPGQVVVKLPFVFYFFPGDQFAHQRFKKGAGAHGLAHAVGGVLHFHFLSQVPLV